MGQSPPFSRLKHLPRASLWIAVFALIFLAALSKPASWAAPVTTLPNQTIPPAKTSTYLPAIHRTSDQSLIEALRANGGFSTLLQTLEATNLTIALDTTPGPFTLFAPTDAAFAQLPAGALDQLLANPTGQLTQILLFHLVPGRYELDDLQQGMQITTQQGSVISVDRPTASQVQINGATIITPNIEASNGIIHAIDTVILPPSPSTAGPVNPGPCGGDDGCKFHIKGGPDFTANGGGEMKLQLFFTDNHLDDGQPQGDYSLAVERDGQLITTFANAKSLALVKNQGDMGPYNYEAKVPVSNLPGSTLEGHYYFWVLDGNGERDSDVFQMDLLLPSQGEIWIAFDQNNQ